MAIQKITSNVLADGAVSASNLEDGSVSASKLAAGSVSASSLGDNSVTEAKLADSSISTAKLADNSVTSAKLANNSVGIDQLNLSDGTNGQILTTNGSGTISFADAAGGGAWNVISSTTVSSAAASIEFTVSGYDSYQIRFSDINDFDMADGTYRNFAAYFSTNGGTSYSTNVRWMHHNRSTRSTTYSASIAGSLEGSVKLSDVYNSSSSSYDYTLSGELTLENNSSSSSTKQGEYRVIHTREYSSALQPHTKRGDYGVIEASPINKIKFQFDESQSGQTQFNIPVGSKFTLYGLATS